MRTDSLRKLQQAARINPHVKVSALAADDVYGEPLVDVYVEVESESEAWTVGAWDDLLEKVDADERTLVEFMDTPAVRAMLRAQEAAHAAA
jgi:hypothetical protein